MMFGMYGALLRFIFMGFNGRGKDAVVQGIGLFLAGGFLALASVSLLSPIILSSFYFLILDAGLVLALVGSGILRFVIGLFSLGETGERQSGGAESPVNYYVALPEEMPAGYCWQCGRHVKFDNLICLRCGATQPKGAQQRAMMSAPTLEPSGDSGYLPQWQEQEPPRQPERGRRGPGRFGGRPAPYPQEAPYPGRPSYPYPQDERYPGGEPYPPHPPQNMPRPGPGAPAFPLPSRPMRRPPPEAPFPGAPYPPYEQQPTRGRQPREKKRSRPRWER